MGIHELRERGRKLHVQAMKHVINARRIKRAGWRRYKGTRDDFVNDIATEERKAVTCSEQADAILREAARKEKGNETA